MTTTKAGSFTVRKFKDDDVDTLGATCYKAFKRFNESLSMSADIDFPSAEMASGVIRGITTGPLTAFGIVAVEDGTGQLLGSGFLNHDSTVHSIGPVFVDPDQSNGGVGKAIITALINQAKEEKAVSIRLTQVAANTKSFCLYLGLGFVPRECYAIFGAKARPQQAVCVAAAHVVGFAPTTDADVRVMEDADVGACAALFKKNMGYDREKSIRASLGPTSWVVSSKTGKILAYTTGFHSLGHTVAVSEEVFVTLFNGIKSTAESQFVLAISPRLHPQLASWALAARIFLVRNLWYMAIGDYKAPPDGVVYFPSIRH